MLAEAVAPRALPTVPHVLARPRRRAAVASPAVPSLSDLRAARRAAPPRPLPSLRHVLVPAWGRAPAAAVAALREAQGIFSRCSLQAELSILPHLVSCWRVLPPLGLGRRESHELETAAGPHRGAGAWRILPGPPGQASAPRRAAVIVPLAVAPVPSGGPCAGRSVAGTPAPY
jgi:hypothetical protein